jgi:hypothetical protein
MRELLRLYYPAQALKPEHLATNQGMGSPKLQAHICESGINLKATTEYLTELPATVSLAGLEPASLVH